MSDFEKMSAVVANALEYRCPDALTQSQQELHPLARFINLQLRPRPPEWLIDGVMQVGLVTVAGTRGVGKTTALLPLAAAVAGLAPAGYLIKTSIRRHVVWATEDVGQAERVLAGLHRYAGWSTLDDIKTWFHVVPAQRLKASDIAKVADDFEKRFTVEHWGPLGAFKARPLIVFDTANSCFDLQNESDNSEVGGFISTLKSAFAHFPIVIVTHVPKALNGSAEVTSLSSRGASAWEADAHQCLYLVDDRGQRMLLLGKKRFETRVEGLIFDSEVHTEIVVTDIGHEEIHLRHSLARLLETGSRAAVRADLLQQNKDDRIEKMRTEALALVQRASDQNMHITQTELRKLLCGKNEVKGDVIKALIAEGYIAFIQVPAELRDNNARTAVLIVLSDSEREVFQKTGELPAGKIIGR